MMNLERIVPVKRKNWFLAAWIAFAVFIAGYDAHGIVGPLAFKTDDLVVSASATVGTTLQVTGLTTATGGINSSAGPTTIGMIGGTVQSTVTTGTINDFVINPTTTTLTFSGGGNVQYNGFKCGTANCTAANDGYLLFVDNSSNSALTLAYEQAGSVAGNRLLMPGGTKMVITPSGGGILQYSGAQTRWNLIAAVTARYDMPFQFTSTLDVSGAGTYGATLTLQSSASFNMNTIGGHMKSTDATGVTFSSGAGNICTCAGTHCTDVAGTILEAVGSTTCTVTLAGSFGAADDAVCLVVPIGTATPPTYTTTSNTIAFTVAGSGVKYKYNCWDTH